MTSRVPCTGGPLTLPMWFPIHLILPPQTNAWEIVLDFTQMAEAARLNPTWRGRLPDLSLCSAD